MTPRLTALALLLAAAAPSAAAQPFSDSHLQAAEDVLVAAETEALMAQSLESTIRLQVEQSPEIAPFEDIMRSFLGEHLSWEALRDDFVLMYAESFTEAELRDVLAFYRTETGRKAIRLMPDLMERGMALGQRAVTEHQHELEARVQARVEKMGRAKATRPGSR